MQYIQLQMVGAARSWLKSRRANSYDSWEEFEKDFVNNFRSTCKRPATIGQLKACKQGRTESLREYIQKWTALKNSVARISEEKAVDSFTNGLRRKDLIEYIGRERIETLSQLMEVANRWADGEELAHNESPHGNEDDDRYERRYSNEANRRKKRRGRGYDEVENTEFVAAEFPASRGNDNRKQGHEPARDQARDQGRERGRDQRRDWQPKKIRTDGLPPMSIEQQLEAPCPNHMFYDDSGVRRSSHKLKDCRRFQLLAEATLRQQQAAQRAGYPIVPGTPALGAPPPPPLPPPQAPQPPRAQQSAGIHQRQLEDRPVEESYPKSKGRVCMIQKAAPSKRSQKLTTRQVNIAETSPPATPEYLRWSHMDITFSREDHPPKVPFPGKAALVVEAQIGEYDLSKVFMDGGSGINIIYMDTLEVMGVPINKLKRSENAFHGIVPGKAEYPVGTITLDVVFGEEGHFRKERLDFEVVDWPSQYHAILGRPAFARFMAVPHYAYLMLKMPGPKGIITIRGNYKKSDDCDIEFNKISQCFGTQQELDEIAATTDHSVPLMSQKTAPGMEFDLQKDTTEHQVHPTDPTKTVRVSNSLPIA